MRLALNESNMKNNKNNNNKTRNINAISLVPHIIWLHVSIEKQTQTLPISTRNHK